MIELDPAQMSTNDIYATMIHAITPRPIAWVSSCSLEGIVNLAPFSYFNGVCSAPASVMFSPVNRPDGSQKDTVRNIESTGEFVVNVVPHAMATSMHQTSAEYEADINEFEAVGLEPIESVRVRPPRVSGSPIHMECRLIQMVPVGDGPLAANIVIGEILLIHVDPNVLDERGKIDPHKLDTIGRMGGFQYCRTQERFGLPPAKL